MSFDEKSAKIVDPHKKTTKVNFGVVIGVLVLFVVGGLVVWWVSKDPPQERPTPLSTEP